MRAVHLNPTSENGFAKGSLFKPLRYLILFFAFLGPITLLAQDEGTVEYSMTSEMKMDMETVMANLPEGMELDSAMVAQMAQTFEQMQNQRNTITVVLRYSGAQALMEMVIPELPSFGPNVSPFGSFDGNMGPTVFSDFEEKTKTSKLPSMGESVPYVMSEELQKLDWVLVDVDSTILDHAVKKAKFVSDSLETIAWYAPGIASTAGPDQYGGLPGLPLSIDVVISRPMFIKMSYVAHSLKEGLEGPILPPVGIPVTQEEYAKIMMKKVNEGAQFVP
jgi:GLPGLI family protein